MTRQSDEEFPLLKQIGLQACPIRGDGNCLFNALSDQIYGHQGMHSEIRMRVIQYMRENPEGFKPFVTVGEGRRRNPKRKNAGAFSSFSFTAATEAETDAAFEAHLQQMARGGTWGDNIEIMAFSHAYNTDVKIYKADHAYYIRASDNGTDKPVAHIAYHIWEHYSSVRNINGPMTGLPHVQVTGLSQEDLRGQAVAPKNQVVKEWMIKAVTSSLPHLVDQTAIKKALEVHNGNVNSAVSKLLDEEYSSSQRSSSIGISSTGSSSVERDPDSDDDELYSPNKRNRLVKAANSARKERKELKEEEASISGALSSTDSLNVDPNASSDNDRIRGPNRGLGRRIKAAKALRKEKGEGKRQLADLDAIPTIDFAMPDSHGTEVKAAATKVENDEADELSLYSLNAEVKPTIRNIRRDDGDEFAIPSDSEAEGEPRSTDENGTDSEFATSSRHSSATLSYTPPRSRPKIILHTKSMQKEHDAPKGRVTARDRKAMKKAAQKQARKESKRDQASGKLTDSTVTNVNRKRTSPPVEKVIGMKVLFI